MTSGSHGSRNRFTPLNASTKKREQTGNGKISPHPPLPAKLFTSDGLPRANVSRQHHQLDTGYLNAGDCGEHFPFKPQQIARVDEHKNADF